jgi:hypothetical protein
VGCCGSGANGQRRSDAPQPLLEANQELDRSTNVIRPFDIGADRRRRICKRIRLTNRLGIMMRCESGMLVSRRDGVLRDARMAGADQVAQLLPSMVA